MVENKTTRSRRSECPISCSLELLGDTWTLLVLRDVLFKGKRAFGDIASEEGIASNILTERLARLEREGILERGIDPMDRRKKVIMPTERAWLIAPLLVEFASFGTEHWNSCCEESKRLVSAYREDPSTFISALRTKA